MLALSSAAAGGHQPNVFGPDAATGPILLQTHLSHPCTGLTALPSGGQLFIPSTVVPRWPTCGSAAVSAACARGPALSGEIITPGSQPIKQTVILPLCVWVCVCVYRSRGWLQQQFLSTHEQMKCQLNENRKVTRSVNTASSLSARH